MSIREYVPDSLRSRYAVKLLGIAVLVVLVIGAIGLTMGLQVSDRVTDEQLQEIENNAELEANQLAQWFEGEQESIRVLSAHERIDPRALSTTRRTFEAELVERSGEIVSLHLAERASEQPSNGTTEQVVVSTDTALEGRDLAATNIDWGEDTEGNEIQYAFDGPEDVLVSWVYLDEGNMSVAIASPTSDGEHVLIAEYHPSTRVEELADVIEGSDTVVLGGVTGYVMFESESPDEFRPYKGEEHTTEVGQQIERRDNQFAPLSGSEIDGDEVRGYHSVPSAGVNWVVVKEVPRSNALALTDQVQTDLATLIAVVIVGFALVAGVIQYGPIRSIKRLARQADAIAEGDLTVDIENEDRLDEVGQLKESFTNTKEYVETIARQSEKLSQQEFDADVLDEEIPGRVGEAMATMREDLERFITQLEAERERYSTLVEQSSDGVAVITSDTVAFANDRFVEITGYGRERLLGMAVDQLVVAGDEASVSELRALLADDSSVTQSQVDIETGEGERRTVELAAAHIDHEDQPATLVNVRDVTERKRRERRLEVFNRVLRHNLRNDLDVISAHLEAIKSGEPDPEAIQMAEQKLADLLSTAETARRIEQAFEQIEIRRYDLETVLDPLVARAEKQYPAVRLSTPDETATVKTADTLPDAVWELLENACEHAGERPQIAVSLSVREDVAVLDISDDGPGLPRTERQTIERGEESAITHSKGLGLWFAHWTAQASGGDLAFDVSTGTTVSLVCPLADGERDDSAERS